MADLEVWPALPLAEWRETCDTLHMWTQIVGKVRMELSPHRNHWWSTALYVTARGLTTSPIPYERGVFDMTFDFLDSRLLIEASDGSRRGVVLAPRSVADFYVDVMGQLGSLGVDVKIDPHPQEFPNPIPFQEDQTHASYDAEYARRFWQILLQTDRLLKEFQSDWLGKASPAHFFWGSFDLCVTRFNGKRAPEREGADCVTKEAYSHECISAGFWPGGGPVEDAAFYSYAAPPPEGYGSERARPDVAYFDAAWHEYILMYEDVRRAADPDQAVRDFLQSTYETGAKFAHWDRASLERPTDPTTQQPNRRRPCASTSTR